MPRISDTLIDSSPRSTCSKNDLATESKASLGQTVNQSMVQQFTSDGNMRHLDLKASPTGLMQITMCNFSWTRLMKWLNMPSLYTHQEFNKRNHLKLQPKKEYLHSRTIVSMSIWLIGVQCCYWQDSWKVPVCFLSHSWTALQVLITCRTCHVSRFMASGDGV